MIVGAVSPQWGLDMDDQASQPVESKLHRLSDLELTDRLKILNAEVEEHVAEMERRMASKSSVQKSDMS